MCVVAVAVSFFIVWMHSHTYPIQSFFCLQQGTVTIRALAFAMRTRTKDTPLQPIFCANNAKKRRFEEHFGWINALKWRAFNFLSWCPRGNTERNSNDMDLETDAFARMHQLKFLQLNCVELRGSYRVFPKKLRWLCWHGFHLEYIPNDLSLKSLICLDMQYSSLRQVWKGSKVWLPSFFVFLSFLSFLQSELFFLSLLSREVGDFSTCLWLMFQFLSQGKGKIISVLIYLFSN